jgi:hypothetical protein
MSFINLVSAGRYSVGDGDIPSPIHLRETCYWLEFSLHILQKDLKEISVDNLIWCDSKYNAEPDYCLVVVCSTCIVDISDSL